MGFIDANILNTSLLMQPYIFTGYSFPQTNFSWSLFPNFFTFTNPFSFGNFYNSNFYTAPLNLGQLTLPAPSYPNIFGPLMDEFKTKIRSSTNNNILLFDKNKYTPVKRTSLTTLKDTDYNAEKGAKLAQTVRKNAVGFTNQCAKYVRIALETNGLGNGEKGDGYEYARILSRNKNFKEISTKNLDLSSLPAGCILVYSRGAAGYSREYGHVEITLGNGQAVSAGITNNIRQGARVFIPV